MPCRHPMLPLLLLLALPAAGHAQVQPGQWDIAVTVNSIDMPGAPPGIAKMMAGKTTRVSQCITPEQAAKGPQEMLRQNRGCRFTRYGMAGGRLNSEMVCDMQGGKMTATTSGSFTPVGFSATGRSVMTGVHAMTMTSTSVGRRVGACRK